MIIGALIVTFNPDIIQLEKNLSRVVSQTEITVIVDNGSRNVISLRDLCERMSCVLIELGNNLGIAAAQNRGFKYLESQSCSWVLTLDQDTLIPDGMISTYTHTISFESETTGILAAQFIDPSWTEAQRHSQLETGSKVTEKLRVLSSGNLVKVAAWRACGGFDEWMFIDEVDFDFDARMILSGYKIWQVNQLIMAHKIGVSVNPVLRKKLLLFPKDEIVMDHASFREFYIQRNTIVYSKRYPMFRRHRFQVLISFIQARRVFLYSPPYSRKLLATFRGILAGIAYRPRKDSFYQNFYHANQRQFQNYRNFR